MPEIPHVSVCICTFRRMDLLRRLLNELLEQKTEGLFSYSVVVVDNDHKETGKPVALDFAARFSISLTYCVEPRQNIALARNKALANAQGDFIAFIDDDEYPAPDWLYLLFKTCEASGADGVLGPVKPDFEQEPPKWAKKGGFFERPSHKTGHAINLSDARTGNVLFRRKILDGPGALFRIQFGTGGEDVDFFREKMDKGCVFVWCNEAVVYESVPPTRCTRSYLLRRALLCGSISFKQEAGRVSGLIKAFIAVPAYGLALPFLLIAGEHHFMKYMIKFCDHAGRLLAMFHINPITERPG